jgi:hypothetical protein
MPVENRAAAILLWVVALGWAAPAPWLMWWVAVRRRLPVLPFIGEPNGGPFYLRASHCRYRQSWPSCACSLCCWRGHVSGEVLG